jgi:imidazolonepropionase-like amidohydrolase
MANGRRREDRTTPHAWPEPDRAALRGSAGVPLVRGTESGGHLRLLALVVLLGGAHARAGETWAIEHARLIPSASGKGVEDATIVLRDGKVTALGPAASVRLPDGARRVDGSGGTVVPGYWNVHVHFTDRRFKGAAQQTDAALGGACREMLTSRGFTSVVDLGSLPANTEAVQRRAATVGCPRILMVATSIFPVHAVPIYVNQELGEQEAAKLPQPATGNEAARIVEESVRLRPAASALKLFTGTWLGGTRTGLMDLAVVKGAAAAHRHGLVVFAHPQTGEGLEAALSGGVDVLGHTDPDAGRWSPELVKRLLARHMALVPTLSLNRVITDQARMSPAVRDRFIDAGKEQLRAFSKAGGQVLFGTDVGFLSEIDTDEEVGWMAAAGLDWRAILVSLTTAPARRMRDTTRGALAVGAPADLVLVDGDPRADVQALTRIRGTWVAGKSVFSK